MDFVYAGVAGLFFVFTSLLVSLCSSLGGGREGGR